MNLDEQQDLKKEQKQLSEIFPLESSCAFQSGEDGK